MTDTEINVAIAEACGWTNPHPEAFFGRQILVGTRPDGAERAIPNYAADLNDMHEARLSLNCLQQNQFAVELMRIVGVNSDQLPEPCVLFELVNATARQRAEVFLRTLGKWKEEA